MNGKSCDKVKNARNARKRLYRVFSLAATTVHISGRVQDFHSLDCAHVGQTRKKVSRNCETDSLTLMYDSHDFRDRL